MKATARVTLDIETDRVDRLDLMHLSTTVKGLILRYILGVTAVRFVEAVQLEDPSNALSTPK